METKDLSSWEQLLEEISALQQHIESKRNETRLPVSKLIFRGQSDHDWKLKTSLERYGISTISMDDYFRTISKAKHYVETFAGKKWEIPTIDEHRRYLEDHDTFMIGAQPGYDYLVYLRHHGFPTPLLDWTYSPYVASFFAFDGANEADENAKISLFAFCEYYGHAKVGAVGTPEIQVRGPYVTSHPRHFKQQSCYTICINREASWNYCPHQTAFNSANPNQDLLWKFTVPSSERRKAILYLDSHNINAYSLYDSEESLVSTVAMRELYINMPRA